MPIMRFPTLPAAYCGSPSGAGARAGWVGEARRLLSRFVGHAMSDAIRGMSSRFKRLTTSFRVG